MQRPTQEHDQLGRWMWGLSVVSILIIVRQSPVFRQSIVLIPEDVSRDCRRSGSIPGQGPTAAPRSL